MHAAVNRRDDERNAPQPYSCRAPATDWGGKPSGVSQSVSCQEADAVDGEAREKDRGQPLPDESVCKGKSHAGRSVVRSSFLCGLKQY